MNIHLKRLLIGVPMVAAVFALIVGGLYFAGPWPFIGVLLCVACYLMGGAFLMHRELKK